MTARITRHYDHEAGQEVGGWTVEGELEEVLMPGADGRPFLVARVPRIERLFRSPMHQVQTMTSRMGRWRLELDAVLGRRMPSGRLVLRGPHEPAEELREAVVDAMRQGLSAALVHPAGDEPRARVALPDVIAETIDLNALGADWTAWLQAAEIPNEIHAPFGGLEDDAYQQVATAITILQEDQRTYADWLFELDDVRGDGIERHLIEGVVRGDDPATTVAYVLKDLTGDQRLWEPLP
jgi:hypothetical protein